MPPTRDTTTQTASRPKRTTVSMKAGLVFPVARIQRFMKEGRLAESISKKSAITLATVLEFLAAEVLELASEHIQGSKRPIIKPRHISLAIRGDEELSNLVGDHIVIPESGVIPYIHPVLELQNKPKKRDSR